MKGRKLVAKLHIRATENGKYLTLKTAIESRQKVINFHPAIFCDQRIKRVLEKKMNETQV